MTAFVKEAVSLWGLGSYVLFRGLLIGGTSLDQASAGVAPLSSGAWEGPCHCWEGMGGHGHKPCVREHPVTMTL